MDKVCKKFLIFNFKKDGQLFGIPISSVKHILNTTDVTVVQHIINKKFPGLISSEAGLFPYFDSSFYGNYGMKDMPILLHLISDNTNIGLFIYSVKTLENDPTVLNTPVPHSDQNKIDGFIKDHSGSIIPLIKIQNTKKEQN